MRESDFNGDEPESPWPAFADLLAATSLLFLILFAAIAIPAIKQGAAGRDRETTLNSLDTLLHHRIADGRVTVQRVGDYLLVRIKEEATFPQNAYELAQLKPEGKAILKDVGDVIRDSTFGKLIDQVQVVGHASAEGGEEKNWVLSSSRAATVSLFLIDSVGVRPCQVSALGRSHYYPVDAAANRVARQVDPRDRRIELEIRPIIPTDKDQQNRREQCVDAVRAQAVAQQ